MIIRNFILTDTPSFVKYRNDPIVAKYQSWKIPFSESEAKKFIQDQSINEIGKKTAWHQVAIELIQESEHIGDCGIYTSMDGKQAEIGITLAREHQHKGYALETMQGLFKFLFTKLSYHRITTLVDSNNESSLKLMEKLKMRKEAYYIESYYTGTKWTDEVQFALLEKEFIED